ncbi:MAG: hypothetical protein ACREP0_03205, partial [Rhodanobacteraceae bacterium]
MQRRDPVSSSFRGSLQLHRRLHPESSSAPSPTKSWIPGSIAGEAGDGPGMTSFWWHTAEVVPRNIAVHRIPVYTRSAQATLSWIKPRPRRRRETTANRASLSIGDRDPISITPARPCRVRPCTEQGETMTQSVRYDTDPAHTFVTFGVRHFNTSTVIGRFDQVEGHV